jgi:hypothetical protein
MFQEGLLTFAPRTLANLNIWPSLRVFVIAFAFD